MITRFSEVVLTRQNGKQRTLKYKTERALTDDLLYSVCSKLVIPTPIWNEASKEFEFDDSFWEGSETTKPIAIEFFDDEGWKLEGFEEEY